MTRKDRLKEVHPNYVSAYFSAGACGCPHDYAEIGLKERDEDCSFISCKECWNKELPEDE